MPRRSMASMNVAPLPVKPVPIPAPPSHLPEPRRSEWLRICLSRPPEWWDPSGLDLLADLVLHMHHRDQIAAMREQYSYTAAGDFCPERLAEFVEVTNKLGLQHER